LHYFVLPPEIYEKASPTMKNCKVIILITLLSSFSLFSVKANASDVNNFLGFWLSGAYSTMLHNVDMVHNEFGGAAELGFTYELQHRHLLFNLGVGYTYQNTGINVPDFSYSQGTFEAPLYDSEGDALIYNYNVSNRIERIGAHYVPIQLMLGGQFGKFYFLAGGKFRLAISASTKVKSDITTTGTYPQFIDDFANMYNHAFFDHKPFESKGTTSLNHCAALSVEIGWRLGMKSTRETGFDAPKDGKARYRLGFFADYGLLNIHRNREEPALYVADDFMSLYQANPNLDLNSVVNMNHSFNTSRFNDSKVNNLFVGIKFTMLFALPHRGPCIHCDDY